MLYASKVLTTTKPSDREGFLGSLNQSTLTLQNACGVSILLYCYGGRSAQQFMVVIKMA
ncbi:MAG: hypothetical protein ACKPCM_03470 [Pseudanabaena sp.]